MIHYGLCAVWEALRDESKLIELWRAELAELLTADVVFSRFETELPNMAELGAPTVTSPSRKPFIDHHVYAESLAGARFYFSFKHCIAAARAKRPHLKRRGPGSIHVQDRGVCAILAPC
ncbi:expressed unknown protein [Ectocarpus siliculosus]|uniref:Uncharacterized protein n=1 Tax=Ectocarpus siliculosus TaxID=2880 RepID=D8LN67_ECTSI|nr:expressed unknown protein [Ectocarpus siliculosus]|eukprot:CBN74830.1 expressed unknown protein [Ectocarpus siliculosus]